MNRQATLQLTRSEVAQLLSLDECIAAVENAFRLHGLGRLARPQMLSFQTEEGGFHIKAALLPQPASYFAAKLNGNFFRNTARFNLPNIQGLILLCDGEHGYPLAVMDSIEITILRTGAATAVAAKHLARKDARVVTICGCGNQGQVQLRALSRILRLERVFAFDIDENRARKFAEQFSSEMNLEACATGDLAYALSRSDVCVTCTPAKKPFVKPEHLRPGTFLAAVGADSAEKQELESEVFKSSKLVADILMQCAQIGELHHALEHGAITTERVHAELGEIVAGVKQGRVSSEETIIFDSTGTALQDVAAAAVVYEKAIRQGLGRWIDFAG
jgi:ornithine cyclodeaminase/alanine dehydrogenase